MSSDIYTIPITWEILHQDIFCEFVNANSDNEPAEFFKNIFPETLFDHLFFQDSLFENDKITAVYYASDSAQTVFSSMRDYILTKKSPNGKNYTYNSCPSIALFKNKWEKYLPFSRVETSGALTRSKKLSAEQKAEIERKNNLEMAIDDILLSIPDEQLNLRQRLSLLNEQHKYSLVLGIMSVIATSLTCFDVKNNEFTEDDFTLHSIVLPPLQADEMSFTMLQSSSIQVTWKMLHEDIYLANNPDSQITGINQFFTEIMPNNLLKEMCAQKNGANQGEISKKYIGNVYHAKNGAKPKFEAAKKLIIKMKTDAGEEYNFRTSPIIHALKTNWETLLPISHYTYKEKGELEKNEQSAVDKLEQSINSILLFIPKESLNVALRLSALSKNESYSFTLAILSVIASTLFCFGMEGKRFSDSDYVLHAVILPPLPEKEASSHLQKGINLLTDKNISLREFADILKPTLENPLEKGEAYYLLYQKALLVNEERKARDFLNLSARAGHTPAIQTKNEETANQLLSEAKLIFENAASSQTELRKCCENCEKLLRLPSFVPKTYTGEASYILYKCIYSGNYISPTGETAEYYLKISHNSGFEAANETWLAYNKSTITPQIRKSNVSSEGVCYSNAFNQISETFEKTLPASWGDKLDIFDLEALKFDLFDNTQRKFLLIDDNFSKNAHDLFKLLQLVKEYSPEKELIRWEIFLRHDSETIRSLIDTALNQIADYTIPVYIINDSKIAAQQLLSQHPLFYPVKSVNLNRSNLDDSQKPLLRFVILGTSDVTEWLIREAFWMLGFRNNAIRTQITILSENGSTIEKQIKGRYPGMKNGSIRIDGIQLPSIDSEDIDLSSNALSERIESIVKSTPYCYFATATNSDEENLSLAIRIRESLIRSAIERKKEENLLQLSPVAFLCRDDQTAWLSKSMVIETEKHGDRWYNTWSIIPFGELSSRYSFDNITGGTFDLLARCVHFQYNQLAPDDIINQTPKACAASNDYYLRQYNQDSSYSIALSMPYRLFQFQDNNGIQIAPTGWSILESTPFSSITQLKNLSKRMKKHSDTKENKEIAEWEHSRWIRWMLSRGWLPLSAEDAVFAFKNGNPRQQLFASKQHPCICSYEDLKKLQDILKEKCDINKDFYYYDLSNIADTQKLLALEWIIDKSFTSER